MFIFCYKRPMTKTELLAAILGFLTALMAVQMELLRRYPGCQRRSDVL